MKLSVQTEEASPEVSGQNECYSSRPNEDCSLNVLCCSLIALAVMAGPIFLKYIQIFFGWMNIQSIVILQCQSLNPRLDILWAPRRAQTPAALRHL